MRYLPSALFTTFTLLFMSSGLQAETLDQNYYSNQARTMYACNTKTDKTNVREGPSSRGYKVVSELLNGQEISVLERIQNPDGYDYYKIVYYQELSGGQLFENIGYVYHEALADTCDADIQVVAERSQNWPLSKRWWGCNFIFQDTDVDAQWSRVENEMPPQSMSDAAKKVCQEAADFKISVKKYLGFDARDQREYFHVVMNGCDAEFSIGDNRDGKTFAYGWKYDLACLDRNHKPQVAASMGAAKSDGFFSTWFDNMFGGAGSYDPSGFSATYTLVCRDRVLLDIDTWKRGPSQSCTGEIYTCQDSFQKQLEANSGSLDAACKQSFGSQYTYENIDYTY